LPQIELEKIMATAFALTFVPYFEGFGIPIIEALQCQTPVICSNTTSMPEIAGNAGLLVNPFEVDSICQGMIEIYNNQMARIKLIENGKIRKNFFSWDKSADLLWNSITKSL
ncbi:MAG: glycosyltransferase, partial [Bacteroidia bacterium]